MKTISVVRWKRYGHDRLYVNDSDGNRLGWADLDLRRIEVENEQYQVSVTGVIAVLCEQLTVRSTPRQGVAIVDGMTLHRWIGAFGKTLSPELVDQIHTQARRSTTWGSGGMSGSPPGI